MDDWKSVNETEIDGVVYHVVRLHEVPHLVDECCDLINMEWKRSHVARIRSISSSCENFPMSLVVVKTNGKLKVVGHCKISKISLSNNKVFIETVVIHPELRGKGLGKFLMKGCEEVCRSKNIKWMYLSTQGQEVFYEKLGYNKCPPINIYGCQLNYLTENIAKTEEKTKKCESARKSKSSNQSNNNNNTPPPPPPPPFPIPLPPIKMLSLTSNSPKTYMRKEIIY